jgi:hypothetical protein
MGIFSKTNVGRWIRVIRYEIIPLVAAYGLPHFVADCLRVFSVQRGIARIPGPPELLVDPLRLKIHTPWSLPILVEK